MLKYVESRKTPDCDLANINFINELVFTDLDSCVTFALF